MSEFTRTKEDVVHECGVLPSDFIHAGAKDKLTMLACLTPEQAFRLGHVIGYGSGLSSGYFGARKGQGLPTQLKIDNARIEHVGRYEKQWHLKKEET